MVQHKNVKTCQQLENEIKRIRNEALENKKIFKAVTDNAAEGIVIATAKKMLFVNKRMTDMLGYSKKEFRRITSFKDFVPPDHITKISTYFRKRISGEKAPQNYTIPLVRKDGKTIIAEISAIRVEWDGKPASCAIIRDITEKNAIEQKLHFLHELQKLIMSMSIDFVKLSVDNLDIGIIAALRSLCEFTDVDRGYIFQYDNANKKMSNTYVWCVPGVVSYKNNLQNQPLAKYPWLISNFSRGKIFNYSEIENLPPEAEPLKSELIKADVKSILCIPLIVGKRVRGYLGFDAVKKEKIWPQDIIMLLQVAAESIANALERKEVEKTLRESREKFLKVFHTSIDPMAFSGIQDGIFIEVNKAFLNTLKFKRDEVVGKSSKNLRIWDDLGQRNQILSIIKQNGFCKDFEVRIRKKTGEIIYGLFSASVIELTTRPVLFAMMKDITERKHAEKTIRESEEKFRTIAEQSIMGIAIVQERRVVYINQAYAHILGYTANKILNWKPGELFKVIHPDDKDFVIGQATSKEAGKIGYIVHYDYRIINGKGETKTISIYSKTINYQEKSAYFVIAHDITTQKKAEEDLKTSEERLSLALEATHDGLWDWDLLHNTSYSNTRCYEIFGINQKDTPYIHKIWKKIVHPDDISKIDDKLRECLSSKEKAFSSEYRIKTHDKKEKWILTHAKVVKQDKQGKPLRLVGTHTDISQQKLMEERLLHSEKMEAIGQLAGGIAHDFNNQLSSIVGYIELLKEEVHDRSELVKYAENIMTATRRASDLTSQLLAFARKGKYQNTPIDVHSTIHEVISLLQHSIDKRIILTTRLHASPPYILGDPTQLQNALLNLALNARDAMPNGGELTFATNLVTLDRQFCKQSPFDLHAGEYLQINVIDEGCGMDEETQKHLFEPFFTTKPDGKGTGMGMAAVYGMVKNHKGAIEVCSETKKGTTVQLYFPHLTPKTNIRQTQDKKVKLTTGTAHILLVDDEAMIRDVGSVILNSLGYKVSLCPDGAEAIELYKKSWKDIDLIILDMVMPKMSGAETFAELRKINPQIKVILSSGYGADSTVQKILHTGVAGFIPKPFHRKDLSEKIAEVLRRKV
jgi:two-component system cell cycle sensor histidine kinase/response regulator CckA